VCYIEETKSYLDYNNRSKRPGTVNSGSKISEIARSVAGSYAAKWTSASEFTFENGAKRLVQTVIEKGDRQIASLIQ